MLRGSVLLSVVAVASGALLSPPAYRSRAPPPHMNLFSQVARNMEQMSDQRVATVSQILLKSGTPLPVEEAYSMFDSWKEEINGDSAKFAEVAERVSECEFTGKGTGKGGSLGVVTIGRTVRVITPPLRAHALHARARCDARPHATEGSAAHTQNSRAHDEETHPLGMSEEESLVRIEWNDQYR
jgi:hypothetical protein